MRAVSRWFVAGALAAGCWLAARQALAQPRMPGYVLCVGDSITAGTGASTPDMAYPAQLRTLFGGSAVVINYGHSGATMLSTGDLPYANQSEYAAATSYASNIGAGSVVDVIIMLGTNDSKAYNWAPGGTSMAAQFAIDTAAMVAHFASFPSHPVVYLALPPDVYTNTYGISGTVIHDQIIPILNQAAADSGIPVIDVNTPTTGHAEYFTDGVHPNDAGYQVVAAIMQAGLLRVPAVALTAPSPGTVALGMPIDVAADASAGTVAIASVEFFAGATSLGVVTQAPFALTWPDAPAGSTTLTAVATDTTTAAAASAPVQIVVASPSSGGCGCRFGDDRPGGIAPALALALVLVAMASSRTPARSRRRRALASRRG
jgi:lysophospholipase L1-like esterase